MYLLDTCMAIKHFLWVSWPTSSFLALPHNNVLSYAIYIHFSHSNFSETGSIQSPEEVKGHSIMLISCYYRCSIQAQSLRPPFPVYSGSHNSMKYYTSKFLRCVCTTEVSVKVCNHFLHWLCTTLAHTFNSYNIIISVLSHHCDKTWAISFQ